MSEPQRIQLSRKRGWKMPANTVKVDRTTKWGNPFKPVKSDTASAKDCVRIYRKFMTASQTKLVDMTKNPMDGLNLILIRQGLLKEMSELRGKNLACWCKPDAPCHADVLLKLANKPP